MTLELYTELKKEIEPRLDAADKAVKSFPAKENGLVEMTEEFRIAKRKFDLLFTQLRALNENTPNKVKREYAMAKRFQKEIN